MSCPSGTSDAAYVLGALPPRERLEFERHLTECEQCASAVRDLAGLPGLLGRIDPRVVEEADRDAPPLPDTLLPALCREVEHRSRVRGRRAALLAAAAVVVAVGVTSLLGTLVGLGDPGPTTAPPATSTTEGSPPAEPLTYRTMEPVGESPVRAEVALERVTWGTRLLLDCTYDADSTHYELPRRVDYYLYVRDREGRAERVGIVGANGPQRRATTWLGVLTVFGGLVAILVDIAPSSEAGVGAIALAFALGLGALAWWLAPVLREPDDGNDPADSLEPASPRRDMTGSADAGS